MCNISVFSYDMTLAKYWHDSQALTVCVSKGSTIIIKFVNIGIHVHECGLGLKKKNDTIQYTLHIMVHITYNYSA